MLVIGMLAMLLGMGVPPSARAARPAKLLQESGRWGDGRFVAGDTILSKAFSAGRLAVAVSRGVIVWDVATLAEVRRIPLPFERGKPVLRDVMLSPDGRRLTVGGEGGAGTWDLRSGKQLFEVRWQGFQRPGVALAPAADLAAVWEKPADTFSKEPARVELWDLRRKTPRPLPAGSPIWELRFLDDARWLLPLEVEHHFTAPPFVLSRSTSGGAEIREPADAPCRTVKATPCKIAAPSGRWIVEVGSQRREDRNRVEPDRPLSLVSVTDGGGKNRLIIAETRPYSTIHTCSGDVCDEIPTNVETARVTLDRRGDRLATVLSQTTLGQRLEVWDLSARRKIGHAPLDGQIYDFALSESGARVLVHQVVGDWRNARHQLAVFAADTGATSWRHETDAWRASRDSSEAWMVEAAGLVTLLERRSDLTPGRAVGWDIDTGEERFAVPIGRFAHGRPLAAGGHVALPASSNGFRPVSARAGADALPADRHAGAVVRLALSDDGALLASAGDDARLIVRSLAGQAAARVLAADAIHDLAFAPGGHQLLAAGRLAATRWDGDTGAPRGELRATLDRNDGERVSRAALLLDRDAVGFLREDHSIEIRPWQADKATRILGKLCPHGFWPTSVSLSGRGWYREPDPSNRFALRELESGAVRPRAEGGAATREWVIADDGRHVLYERYGGGGMLLGTTDASETPAPLGDGGSTFTAAAFTPDARLAVTAQWNDATVRVWDVKTKAELDAVDLSATFDHATALAISKTGDELFVGTARGVVYRYRISRAEHE